MPVSYDPKENLLQHSEAKVTLLHEYLRNYLSVVANSKYTNRISIFDVFCGRGIYENGKEGSPLVILRAIREVHSYKLSKGQRMPKINCFFADKDEENVKSVENVVKDLNLYDPVVGKVRIERRIYRESLKTILTTPSDKSEKYFVFIDPYGYSDVRVPELKAMLDKGAEVLLFLPTQFMYRFEGQGTPDALKQFISDLGGWKPSENKGKFVEQLRDAFRKFMGSGVYVSTFLIEKDTNTLFSLFFFTTSVRGHEKMVDAKWKVDRDAGHGWSFRKVPGQESLISNAETYLERELLDFFKSGRKDNCEVYEFVVINREYRATQGKQACQKLIREGKITAKSSLGEGTKPKGLYINCDDYTGKNRKVLFEVIQ